MADSVQLVIEAIDKATAPLRRIERATGGLDRTIGQFNHATPNLAGGLSSASMAAGALGAGMAIAGKFALDLGIAIAKMGVQAAIAFGKATVDAAEFSQTMVKSLGMISGKGEVAGGAEFDAIRKLAAKLGLEVRSVTEKYRDLRAMQFSVATATDLVKMAGDMQALGADAQTVESVMRAITQIKGKGKLQMEELTSQLAEAKVSTELVVAQLAKMRNVAPDAIRKMISAGKIGADEGVTAIQRAVMQKLNITKLGEAGEKMALTTIKGLRGRLVGVWENLWIDLGAKVSPVLMKLAPLFEDMFAALESPAAQKVLDAIVAVIGGLVDAIVAAWPVVKAFAKGFGEGFSKAWDGVTKGLEAFQQGMGDDTNMQDWIALANAMGTAFGFLAAAVLGTVAALLKLEKAWNSAFGTFDASKLTGAPMQTGSSGLMPGLGGLGMGNMSTANSLAVSVTGVGKNEQELAVIIRREAERFFLSKFGGALPS